MTQTCGPLKMDLDKMRSQVRRIRTQGRRPWQPGSGLMSSREAAALLTANTEKYGVSLAEALTLRPKYRRIR